jgi:nucleoside-diphosphate-sugar epimerase
VASAEAISRGLRAHTADRPGYWIHTSGTGVLTFEDFRASSYGDYRAKEYNDWDGIGEVTSLPDDALHRNVDKIVLASGQDFPDKVKTAIVCPPTIYGPGRGPGNNRSAQVYNLTREGLKRKKGIQVGSGKNIWHSVHVQDLSDIFLAIGESAVNKDGKATWGAEGYYFAENGQFEWGDIQRRVAEAGFQKKLLPSAELEVVDGAQADSILSFGSYMWGTNSRGHAIRGRKLFGWTPSRPSLTDLVPDIVDLEAKSLGLI